MSRRRRSSSTPSHRRTRSLTARSCGAVIEQPGQYDADDAWSARDRRRTEQDID